MQHKVIIYQDNTHQIRTVDAPTDSSREHILQTFIELVHPTRQLRFERDKWGVHAICKRDNFRIFCPFDERNLQILEAIRR